MADIGSSHATTNQNTDVAGIDTPEDHPQGDEIRRQVEYYFSDENLPTDLHLLKCCGGRENLPVRISSISGFKKMRGFKPKRLVVAALRMSAFLEVSADGKTIKRKVPLQGKCALDEELLEDEDDIAYDPRSHNPDPSNVALRPQQKAKQSKGVSKNMRKPTGFEKSYVEPPQTLHEAVEEEAMYDLEKSFIERIEVAVQRFKQKRRMHEMYALVFNKLMRFGGVENTPRMYQGLSQQDMKDMDAEELARALATHTVPWDRSDEKQWVVDFVGVGRAFLSSWYPTHCGYAPDSIKNACQVLRSFYNYLLYHNVCPEYKAQLETARSMCDIAEQELPKVNAAGLAFPGDFNKSASTLLGGAQAGLYTGDKAWAIDLRKEGIDLDVFGMCGEEARILFSTGIAIMGSDEQYEKVEKNSLKVLSHQSTGLEITAICPSDDQTKSYYKEQSQTLQHKLRRLEPLGKLICKAWNNENSDEWDLSMDGVRYPGGKPGSANNDTIYEFWIEESILEQCFVGLKMYAKILVLDGGLAILDDVNETMCSFFTWLPNELWMERKPKEVKWLKKGLGMDEDDMVEGGGVKIERKTEGGHDDEFDDE